MLIYQIESEGKGAEIFVDEDLALQIGREGTTVAEMERQKVDFIVSVGGDGTILRTIHKMADPVPILGINMGTLGLSGGRGAQGRRGDALAPAGGL